MNLMRIKKSLFNGFVLSLILGVGILFAGCSKSNSIVVDKAWLDANLGGSDNNINTQGAGDPQVLFIAVTKDLGVFPTGKGTFYGVEHIGKKDANNNIIWEAVKVPWSHEVYPDTELYTFKTSAFLDWKNVTYNTEGGITGGTVTRIKPGFLSQADPNSVAWAFEELGIVHGVPSDPRNDIDLVFYIQAKYNYTTQYAAYLYWLLELYGYPPDKMHILDGGLLKWKKDGGSTVQNSTGPTITPGKFIPEVREDIFADKTMLQAISSGKVRGAIIRVRPAYNTPLVAGGNLEWSLASKWFDPLEGYAIPGAFIPGVADKRYKWTWAMVTEAGDTCSSPTEICVWMNDGAGNVVLDPILETFFNNNNIGKDDPIIVY